MIKETSYSYNRQKHGGASLAVTSAFLVTTRQQRKQAIKILIQQLQIVLAAEKRYLDDLPDDLPCCTQYDEADQAVGAMEEALSFLSDVY